MAKISLLIVSICVSINTFGQHIELIKLESLDTLINAKSSKVKVINFWASWCGPCVKEMPHFDELGQSGLIDLYFISLDFANQKQKAQTLLARKNIRSKTYLLDEKDSDKYIRYIYRDWSGAIPATLFISPSGDREFIEKAMQKDQLENIVNKLNSK